MHSLQLRLMRHGSFDVTQTSHYRCCWQFRWIEGNFRHHLNWHLQTLSRLIYGRLALSKSQVLWAHLGKRTYHRHGLEHCCVVATGIEVGFEVDELLWRLMKPITEWVWCKELYHGSTYQAHEAILWSLSSMALRRGRWISKTLSITREWAVLAHESKLE